ncbi:hypothetical protein MIMGU_mgv1a020160mg [Erythranthe guttata]|uniref:DYW domain-containing protein n=1 Tax=Erythranthe guttata TaxID=4155 RepID=A0A022Q6T8_ERYGU|nr:hypothetical protein MIMGU_mgv1a020160mg [Erythranthe guttata]
MNSAEQFCVSLLNNCRTLRSLQHFHARAAVTGLDSDPLVAGKLLLHSAVHLSGALDYARRLLLHNPCPDTFMYNTLIRGFSDSASPQNSVSTFSLMLQNLDSPVDSFSLAFTLKSAANMRCLRTGTQLHSQALTRGLHTHLFVGTTLISMYAECGCVEFAQNMFDEIPEPNIVTWNALVTAFFSTMIVGFAQHGCFNEAFEYFRELHKLGITPNEVSLTGALSACAQAGALEFAKILHGYIEKVGFVWMIPVNNALTDTYSKCGSIDMALLVFQRMPGEKSIVSWTSIIAGLAIQGYGEEALSLFHEMEYSGIKPDGILFVTILYACSHSGLVEKGDEIFDRMTKIYGITPEIEHYGCMVDLYGRAGQLAKAYDFVSKMTISPNAVIWRTLLGACSFHGDLQLAERVKRKLSELDPKNSGDHVLLSNIYAFAGKWKDVATVRRSMAELKLVKTPGWSMIEVDKEDDAVIKEAYEKLKEVMLRIRVEGGYVPEVVNVLHDIEEEEKEGSVMVHSEKLAVAFGMGRLTKGKIVRVVKNLRVCKDCHNVMKLISEVYGLEILLRDRSRFHSFKNGSCSCKDYW